MNNSEAIETIQDYIKILGYSADLDFHYDFLLQGIPGDPEDDCIINTLNVDNMNVKLDKDYEGFWYIEFPRRFLTEDHIRRLQENNFRVERKSRHSRTRVYSLLQKHQESLEIFQTAFDNLEFPEYVSERFACGYVE